MVVPWWLCAFANVREYLCLDSQDHHARAGAIMSVHCVAQGIVLLRALRGGVGSECVSHGWSYLGVDDLSFVFPAASPHVSACSVLMVIGWQCLAFCFFVTPLRLSSTLLHASDFT